MISRRQIISIQQQAQHRNQQQELPNIKKANDNNKNENEAKMSSKIEKSQNFKKNQLKISNFLINNNEMLQSQKNKAQISSKLHPNDLLPKMNFGDDFKVDQHRYKTNKDYADFDNDDNNKNLEVDSDENNLDANFELNQQQNREAAKLDSNFDPYSIYGEDYDDDDDVWYSDSKLIEDHLNEVKDKWNAIDDEIWAKIICMERNRRVAKAYARKHSLTINGSCDEYLDGSSLGLNSFENPERDSKITKVKQHIGKGIRLKITNDGDIVVKRLSQFDVFAFNRHDFSSPQKNWSPSSQVSHFDGGGKWMQNSNSVSDLYETRSALCQSPQLLSQNHTTHYGALDSGGSSSNTNLTWSTQLATSASSQHEDIGVKTAKNNIINHNNSNKHNKAARNIFRRNNSRESNFKSISSSDLSSTCSSSCGFNWMSTATAANNVGGGGKKTTTNKPLTDLRLKSKSLQFNLPFKLFDMAKFKANLRRESQLAIPNRSKLQNECVSVISFVVDERNLLNLPVWLLIINIVAMDLLKSTLGLVSLRDLHLSHHAIQISSQQQNTNNNKLKFKTNDDVSSKNEKRRYQQQPQQIIHQRSSSSSISSSNISNSSASANNNKSKPIKYLPTTTKQLVPLVNGIQQHNKLRHKSHQVPLATNSALNYGSANLILVSPTGLSPQLPKRRPTNESSAKKLEASGVPQFTSIKYIDASGNCKLLQSGLKAAHQQHQQLNYIQVPAPIPPHAQLAPPETQKNILKFLLSATQDKSKQNKLKTNNINIGNSQRAFPILPPLPITADTYATTAPPLVSVDSSENLYYCGLKARLPFKRQALKQKRRKPLAEATPALQHKQQTAFWNKLIK